MRKPKHDGVCFASAEKILKLVRDKTVTTDELRMYLFMIKSLDLENYIDQSTNEIATELRMTPTTVTRAINGLIKRKILFKVIEEGQRNRYYMNPDYVRSSRIMSRKEAL